MQCFELRAGRAGSLKLEGARSIGTGSQDWQQVRGLRQLLECLGGLEAPNFQSSLDQK